MHARHSHSSSARLAAALAALLTPLASAQAPISTELALVDTLGQPVQVLSPPGDPRLFVVELEGAVRLAQAGGVSSTPFLDVSGDVQLSIWSGLRAAVFHPDYAANGFVYVFYDAASSQGGANDAEGVIDRFTVSASDPDVVDPTSRVEIFRFYQPVTFHGGGCMKFGQDGLLYFAIGDGGGGSGDPDCNAQNPALVLGKMLRIDVDTAFPYAIPPDNPFVADPAYRDEIWHTGLRHPWRWSFDRLTGDMYITDVGQHDREELDIVPAGVSGLNFGWKMMEGTTCYNALGCPGTTPACGAVTLTPPSFEYDTGPGCSIIGGYVYRGSSVSGLDGQYMFGDYCTGAIWTLEWDGAGGVTNVLDRTTELGGPFNLLSSFGEDADGELYLVVQSGEIHRIVQGCAAVDYCAAAPNSVGPGADLSWSGSSSLTANDFTLEITSAPPGQPGLFYYGPSAISVPFGEGTRCVGGTTSRLNPPVFLDASGATSRLFDFASPPAGSGPGEVTAGELVRIQFWYRDPAGGGAGFNLSDALSAVFCP